MRIKVSMGVHVAGERKQPFVPEGRCHDLFDDGVSQGLPTAEITVERSFGDPADGQTGVEACTSKTQSVHLAKTRL